MPSKQQKPLDVFHYFGKGLPTKKTVPRFVEQYIHLLGTNSDVEQERRLMLRCNKLRDPERYMGLH